ncbi:hypothetical protein [Candidatus Enterococcus clewellii]|uniref:Uncharacterized protein n=1 Tax=Candidatus Enterococcus clewellii TaxID=1834193 RepID=A0A242K1H8_9ENTE|nr:hypothetical protein [Enterococcus sp. 9E7_DIV0242]OTP11517.1 hypothetical protein A5888_003616 [Enterococcus sp. 9E7_DIV0242]
MLDKLRNFKTANELRQAFLSWAAIDILLEEEYAYRVYDWIPVWTQGQAYGKIDNGAGDELIALFGENDCIIKGFDHESALSPHAQEEFKIYDGLYEQAPKELLERLFDPAIEHEHVTFCIWQTTGDDWHKEETAIPEGEDDGEEFLMGYFHSTVEAHSDWIKDYYEIELDQSLVLLFRHFFYRKPITQTLLIQHGFGEQKERIFEELEKIGYPVEEA